MSTSNSTNLAGLSAPGSVEENGGASYAAASPAALGLPDAALVAQLANALFGALPGRPTVPATAADAQAAPPTAALPVAPPAGPEGEFASLPVAPYVSPTSGFSPPGDVDLRPAPASLASTGGLAAPTAAATPPPESPPYFLDPAQPGLPGTAVGLGPSSATRLEAGAMPTAPSPPSAFAQPAEPNLRTLPATTDVAPALPSGVPASGPYSFRPELVPAPTATAPAGSAATPTPVPPATLPQETGTLPAAAATPPLAATAPRAETDPRGLPGGPGLPPAAAGQSGTSFYFLDEANRHSDGAKAAPDFHFDPFGFPAVVSELEFGAYPFDSRAADPATGLAGVTRL